QPIQHGVYVSGRDKATEDPFAGAALRTFPGYYTLAVHFNKYTGRFRWGTTTSMAPERLGAQVDKLPGWAEAKAVDGGVPPSLVLVVCDPDAPEAVLDAAQQVARAYGQPVVVATGEVSQPKDRTGDVVTAGRWRLRDGDATVLAEDEDLTALLGTLAGP